MSVPGSQLPYQTPAIAVATPRRVAEFEAYKRLFSLRHVMHMPIMFIILVAAVEHIAAVHVY
jgi:hypothetical protein